MASLSECKNVRSWCLWIALKFALILTATIGFFFYVVQIKKSHEIGVIYPFNNNKKTTKQSSSNHLPQPLSRISAFTSDVLDKWWNYNTSFTKCEQELLGWHRDKQFLAEFNPSSKRILCSNYNLSSDYRHAHIECYGNQWRNTNICILKNVYGYVTASNELKFKTFCSTKPSRQNQAFLSSMKQTFQKKGGDNTNYPLFINMMDDSDNANLSKIHSVEYKAQNKDLWYYDNSHQCEWHKNNDAEHIGNPWHCFGHLEYWFGIAHAQNISKSTHNLTVIQSQFDNEHFGPNEAIYHFYEAFFNQTINKDSLKESYKIDELFYIKELILDERIAKDWGMSVIWQHEVKKKFDHCPDQTRRRSEIYYEMREKMLSYYANSENYASYDWINEIMSIKNEINKFEIMGELEQIKEGKRLVFVASRWVNGVCRYRCIGNGKELRNELITFFDSMNFENYVILYGNPGILSFSAQYHLFKNCDTFVGVHGAVFLMASLFMAPNTLKMEITVPYPNGGQATAEDVVAYFDDSKEESYANHFCRKCTTKSGQTPSNVDINLVMDAFTKKYFELYRHGKNEELQLDLEPTKNKATSTKKKEKNEKYSECEQKYFGWERSEFGDFSLKESEKQVVCANDEMDKGDVRHLDMSCWTILNDHGPNRLCILENVYAYKAEDGTLKFEGLCKHKLDKNGENLLDELKNSFDGGDKETTAYPLYLSLIADDELNKNDKIVQNVTYNAANERDVWYYDNSHQCESHKNNDAEHIGNPWHCFGHLEYFYHIAHRLNLSRKSVPIYHFFTPFFQNIYNKESVQRLNGKEHKIFIKKMIIDERVAKGWGLGTVWKWASEQIEIDKLCKGEFSKLRRSPIMLEMKDKMQRFYEANSFYSDYLWLDEIRNVTGQNEWKINGELKDNSRLILVASRWMNGVCRYRCLKNIGALSDKLSELFVGMEGGKDYVVVFGNPGSLSFRAQYHLFKRSYAFIGVHGAVYLMAGMFMEPHTFKFEIIMGESEHRCTNSKGVVARFDGKRGYRSWYCPHCKYKESERPSDVDVDKLGGIIMNAFKETEENKEEYAIRFMF